MQILHTLFQSLPFGITESEKCYLKNRIFDESIISMCQNCLKLTIQHKIILRFGLIVFLFKSLMYLT